MGKYYLAFTNNYDMWPDEKVAAFREFSGPIIEWLRYKNSIERIEWTAFKDVAAAVTGYLSYEPPPYFPPFLQLPAELRKIVYHHYLLEHEIVWPDPHNPHTINCYFPQDGTCCVWHYPTSLKLCNESERTLFANPLHSSYWSLSLPALASTCGQLQGEVVVYMLERTQWIFLNFEAGDEIYDGGSWFHNELTAIPHGDGLRAVKNLAIRLGDVSHLFRASLISRSPW